MTKQRRWLTGKTIALSVSPPEDLAVRGLGPEHLHDALGEITRQLLALGAQLIYGGDLRIGGVTKLLFELAARYAPPLGQHADRPPSIIDVLAFPMHAELTVNELTSWESEFAPIGELRYLGPRGEAWSCKTRPPKLTQIPSDEWPDALTTMRRYVTTSSHARIVLGGKAAGFVGRMPGITEEALVSVIASQPLFAVGGFGGAASAVASQIAESHTVRRPEDGELFPVTAKNGLDDAEEHRLAVSPHIDEITLLLTRGLTRVFAE